MKQLLISLLCIFSLEAKATYMTTGIAGLDVSQDASEDIIVMATSGDVLWASSRAATLIATLKKAIQTRQLVELEVNEKSSIIRAKLLPEKVNPSKSTEFAQESNFQAFY